MTRWLATAAERARAMVWRLRGARLARKVGVGPLCRVSHPRGVAMGERTVLEAAVWLKLVSRQARLSMGAHTFIGRNSTLDVLMEVVIGDHVLLGPGCVLVDHNHGMSPALRMDEQPCAAAPIRIGRDVWCGAYVVVLPGITIGDGAVIGAHSVVTRDIPALAVAVGAPARVVGSRDRLPVKPGGS